MAALPSSIPAVGFCGGVGRELSNDRVFNKRMKQAAELCSWIREEICVWFQVGYNLLFQFVQLV